MEIMSHLKFNGALVRAFIKKGKHSTPKVTTMVGAYVLNLEVLLLCNGHEHQGRKGCVWCVKRR
jgi:hypothetical protein